MNGSVNVPGASAADLALVKKTADDAAALAQKALDASGTMTISAVPSQSGALSYTGQEQTPTWNNYTEETLTIGGVTAGTDAGTYEATFTPNEGYKWSDGTTDPKTVSWTINRATIATVPSQSGSLTYSGQAQTPTWSGYDSSKMTLGGTTSGTAAGSYNATFTPGANYQWSDGSTTAKTVAWSIGRATISTVPSQSGSLTYTGSVQSPSWSGYDSAKMSLGGTTSGTAAGSYNATFTPGGNYQWSDGTTTAKTVAWSIGKAAGSLSLSPTSLSLNATITSGAITVTRAGDGAITAKSSDTSVATVSVSGTTVTVTGKAYGTATITVSVAAGTNHTAPADKTCSVAVNIFNSTLESNTWAQIKAASDAGEGANFWDVGDVKAITINGKAGATTFSNLSVNAFILGFNHNSAKEGSNKIHFQIGKIGTTDVCLCDSSYGNSSSTSGAFTMNTSNTNSGGWSSSHMRKTVLGSDSSPTSPTANTLLACLPSDLRAVMKPITKYSDNTGGGSNTASYVTATTDYLPLLSEFEVQGTRNYANSAEQNSQAQYDYYKAGNSKVKYKHNATGTAAVWWLRSVAATHSNYFCLVITDGSAYYYTASYSYGVAPGFAA